MTLEQIKKVDISYITLKSSSIRRKELGKTKNAIFTGKQSNKFYFSSPHTFNKSEKYKIVIEKNQNDIKVHCSCEAFSKQGFQYRCSQQNAAVKIEKRKDKRWGKYHGGALLCKHLYLLLNSNQIKKVGI